MKKALAIILVICSFVSFCSAETNNDFYPYNLQDANSYDDVINTMVSLFGEGKEETGEYRQGDYAISPTAKLFGINISDIYISKGFTFQDVERWKWRLKIQLENRNNSAETIALVYDNLSEIYGEPLGMYPIVYDYDFNGTEKVVNPLTDMEELQQNLDSAKAGKYTKKIGDYTSNSFSYDFYWENCSMEIYVSDYSSTIYIEWIKYGDGENIQKEYMWHKISD